jgi:hypothetical protein
LIAKPRVSTIQLMALLPFVQTGSELEGGRHFRS